MEKFPASSKANNYPAMLEYLFDLGRQTADAWLTRHGTDIGHRSTFDLQALCQSASDHGGSGPVEEKFDKFLSSWFWLPVARLAPKALLRQ